MGVGVWGELQNSISRRIVMSSFEFDMVVLGDCREVMAGMPEASVDAICTDPPYGLEFMGKEWDKLIDDLPEEQVNHQGRRGYMNDGSWLGTGYNNKKRPVSYPTRKTHRRCQKCGKRDFSGTPCQCRVPDWVAEPLKSVHPAMVAQQRWHYLWAVEAFRVLKPGGHMLVMGGTRTHHRMMCAVEDAGFEIRDVLMWCYGQGFPKSMDVSKAIDKVIYTTKTANPDFQKVRKWLRDKVKIQRLTYKQIDTALGNENSHKASHYLDNSQPQLPSIEDWEIIKNLLNLDMDNDLDMPPRLLVETFEREIVGYRKVQRGVAFTSEGPDELPVTIPLSTQAEQWEGYGTALKPAYEPIVLARKPISEKNIAENVLRWGVGGLWIDGCRIGYQSSSDQASATPQGQATSKELVAIGAQPDAGRELERIQFEKPELKGRFPANFILSHYEDCVPLHEGVLVSDGAEYWACVQGCPVRMLDGQTSTLQSSKGAYRRKHGDSQFLGQMGDGRTDLPTGRLDSGGASRFFYTAKVSRSERNTGMPEGISNSHPTLKPISLMRYLCRLVTPPGGIILDPFAGSGTTLVAGLQEGFQVTGIDSDPTSWQTAWYRVSHELERQDS